MKKLASVCVLAALTLTACGGGGRPSTEDIEKSLKSGDSAAGSTASSLDDSVISCMAEALEKSDVSDDALQAFVDGDTDYKGSSDDEDAINDIQDDMASCATG